MKSVSIENTNSSSKVIIKKMTQPTGFKVNSKKTKTASMLMLFCVLTVDLSHAFAHYLCTNVE